MYFFLAKKYPKTETEKKLLQNWWLCVHLPQTTPPPPFHKKKKRQNPTTFWYRKTLLQMYLTIQVTSTTSGRTFSALNRLRNYLRSTMREDHLNNYLLIRASDILRGRGVTKFRYMKIREDPQNSLAILCNTCRYNISETCLGYWGCLIAANLQIYRETSSPQRVNDVPKLPGVSYVAKNWALVMMLKALPLANFFRKLGC